MASKALKAIEKHLGELTDPRVDRTKDHKNELHWVLDVANNEDHNCVHKDPAQGSGLSGGLAAVEALAVVPAGTSVAPGHPVDTILLDPGPSAAVESPLWAMAP